MSKFYVYGLFEEKEDIFDKCFYIGKGCGNRLNEHFFNDYKKGDNPYKDRKINKIGKDNIYASKIRSNLSEEKAYELEEFLIDEIGLDNLTNLIPGGKGSPSGEDNPMYGETRSDEVKKKLSEYRTGMSLSEETKKKIAEAHLDKSRCEKTKRKMSAAKIGESNPDSKLREEQAREIKWLALNSNLTQNEIADKYPICRQQVSRIKLGKRWSHIDPRKPEDFRSK